jgi:hypothetical protein
MLSRNNRYYDKGSYRCNWGPPGAPSSSL